MCAFHSRIEQLIFIVYTNIIKHCNCKPSDFWQLLISYISCTYRTDGNSCNTHGPLYFSPLAGISTHGIYDSLFLNLLDLRHRHISIAAPGSKVFFICTETFSRQSEVRTSGKVSSEGHVDGYSNGEYLTFILFDLLYFLQSFYSQPQIVHSDALYLLSSFAQKERNNSVGIFI